MLVSLYDKNEAINYCFTQCSCDDCKYKAINNNCKLLLKSEVKK